ncbi:MAG: phosphosulfolactate synthase [Firmicutes bacterium ZCTH02-B6]|nr:MAG: phosphosulfolactate synthase [Firmicutes bacterium ZCTH02-B6]
METWFPLGDPVPGRQAKPRRQGLTMVIDKGLGPAATRDLMAVAAAHIDFVKLGFGSSLVYPQAVLVEKIRILREAGVYVCPGGTLLEVAVYKGAVKEFLAAAARIGFTHIEVSEGTIDLAPDVRRDLIRRARDTGFGALAEIGKKDPGRALVPEEVWRQAAEDLAAGAQVVIIEGRDSGRGVGIYDAAGQIRTALLEALAAGFDDMDRVMWEAPQTQQQQALLLRFGPDINLGNVQPADALALEAMRRGLRGDTFRRCLAAAQGQRIPT